MDNKKYNSVITEQGDLGLGVIPVTEDALDFEEEERKKKDKERRRRRAKDDDDLY